MTRPLAIVVKGWPRLSETFIAQELVALEDSGLDFELWSLRYPTDKKTHPLHERLKAPVRYLPEYLHEDPERVWSARAIAQTLPGYERAYAIWRRDLARDRDINRVRRFGQACVLAAEMPDTVRGLYAHFLHTPSSVARYAAIIRGLPWSFSAHAKDIWTSPDWDIAEKLSDDDSGATFGATCTAYGAAQLRHLAADPARIDLVYHGLDLGRFPTPPKRDGCAKTGPFRLLSVGRLVEKKGFDRLITAFSQLPTSLDWHWVHIGGGTLAKDLAAQANACGISDRITWRGACNQPQVIEAMRDSDLFILPSRIASDGDRDGLPNVLMEAASQRLPILSTVVSAIPEFIENGVHGTLASDDPQALATAIRDLAASPDKRQKMADAAFDRLHNEFSMAPGIRHLARRLNQLIGAA